jgi:DNA cross-link repair 1C protein
MPTGTPFHSFVPPYPIRVDEFTSPATLPRMAALHLLTHTHSDHLQGLAARSFSAPVICSSDAKEMLLRHEVYSERNLFAQELKGERRRTYAHLKVDPIKTSNGTILRNGARDLLVRV